MRLYRGSVLLALFCLLLTRVGAAASGPLVVVLLPDTSLSDWRTAAAPSLHQLMSTGALAVMNTRTARMASDRARESPESAALTLNAGARAAGGAEITRFFPSQAIVPEVGVPASALYARRMGMAPLPGALINVDWPRVLRENTNRGYDLHPGRLGDDLRTRHVRVLAGGSPFSFPVSVNGSGQVLPLAAPLLPAANQTCVVWDAGNNPAAADGVIQAFADQTRARHGRLLILSPFVSDGDYKMGWRLAPVLLWGEGVPAGLLFSHSTRRAGLITNTDFAPYILSWFNSPASSSPWSVKPAPDAVFQVARLEESAYRQANAMRILPYVALLLAAVMALGTILAALGRLPRFWPLLPMTIVLALLLGTSPDSALLWLFLAGSATVFLAVRFGTPTAVAVGCGLLSLVLVSDLCLGDPLMRRSLLGYSAIEGARYYGMGNEAMGVLIGATLATVSSLWPKAGRLGRNALSAGLAVVALLLGSPFAGAKAGGLLVSLSAFGVLALGLSGRRVSPRFLLLLLAGTILALGLVAALDSRRGGGSSHMGQAVARIQARGGREAEDIIARKLSVEGRLLYHSAWVCPLWIGLAGFLWRRRKDPENEAGESDALRAAGLVALAACLAVNDAGVVAAALCVSLLWSRRMTDAKKDLRPEV